MARARPASAEASVSLLKFGNSRTRRRARLRKWCLISLAILLLLSIVLFLLAFVGFPVLFMYSIKVQRFLLFEPIVGVHEEFESVRVAGMRNFYVSLNGTNNVTLGVWHLLPEEMADNSNVTFDSLTNSNDYPVLLHFHGNGGNRFYNLDVYLEYRRYFHVIAFDYRGFGDSTNAELTEEGLVQDSVELYKWLSAQINADIFVWGHSMGTAVATHTVARLRGSNISMPAGLILESPYTTLREEALHYPLAKILSWLPWYNVTILDAIKKNGFRFETSEHILNVDCPIMILHAKDDDIIPYFLGEKLARVAREQRNSTTQGNVTLHLFPAEDGYEHWGIYRSPKLPGYIREHIGIARAFKEEQAAISS